MKISIEVEGKNISLERKEKEGFTWMEILQDCVDILRGHGFIIKEGKEFIVDNDENIGE